MGKNLGHRDRLMKAANKLVLQKGLNGTRIDEICLDAEVTKGSFYHHFESKEHLAAELLEDFFQRLAKALQEGGWTQIVDERKRVIGLLDRAVELAEGPMLRNGCIMGVLTVDLEKGNDSLLRDVGKRFNAVVEMISPVVEAALVAKGFAKRAASEQAGRLARQFIAVMEGGILIGKATGNKNQLTESMQCFRTMVIAMLSGK